MNNPKYDRKVCGEIQVISHIIIVFAIGFYFGVSFVPDASSAEASAVSYAIEEKTLMLGNP